MQFIPVTLVSEKRIPPCVINVPILSYENFVQRVEEIANRNLLISVEVARQSFVYCRELFQERRSDLFFFPSARGKCVSLKEMGVGNIFFLRDPSSWSFILCFNPNATGRTCMRPKTAKLFSEDQGYPEGVGEAASFFISNYHISILVSPHGSITMDNDGKLSLKGINVFLLQKNRFSEKSILVQRKNESVSPNRTLRAGVEPLQRYNKYIKVRCICNAPAFCYSTQFPVLSEKELEQEIEQDQFNRMKIYGSRQNVSGFSVLKYYFFQPPSADVKHMIMFPYKMGIDVPFGCFEGGRMFFSYAETPFSEHSSGNVKITFFPNFFEINKNIQFQMGKNLKKYFKAGEQTSFSVCGARKVSTFIPVGIHLVPVSPSEYQLVGATAAMISTKNHGGWGVCFSRKIINLSNAPIPGPSGVESREAQQERSRNPLPGPSGVERRKSTTQATTTVSVSPGQEGQQTQQKKSKSPVPGGPGKSSYAYGYSLHSLHRATISVPPERQKQQRRQEGRSSPLVPSGIEHREDTVVVPPKRQGKQTQKRKNSSPVSSDVSFHPYPYEQPQPYGPLPFCGGLYSYRSPITTPHHQEAFTVSVPPESESIQTQQEGRSSPLRPSGVEHREATASISHADATVVVPPEEQRQQTQQRSSSPLPDSFGVRHQLICPIPFRAQLAASAFMQFEKTQQRSSSPLPGPSGVSFRPYPQHEPWPFSGGPSPYFYPEIGSFVEGSYPYGSPFPPYGSPFSPYGSPFSPYGSPFSPYHHSFARQGQWMPAFPPPVSAVRPSVAAFNPLRYEIPVQEGGFGHSARAAIPVEAVQQTPIWRPYEETFSAEVPSQDQVDDPDEDK